MCKRVVSIIIPIYNAEAYLSKCLDSIISQTDKCGDGVVEVICVDDGSKDGSLSILDKYALDYEFIKVIHQDNSGPAAARSAGLDGACGEWVWFVDPDDYVTEDSLSAILNTVKEVNADICIFDAYEHKVTKVKDDSHGKDIVSSWEHFSEAIYFIEKSDICAIQRMVLYPHVSDVEEQAFASKGLKGYSTPIAAPWDKVYRRQFLMYNGLRYNKNLRVLDDMVFNMQAFGMAERVVYSKKKIYHYIRNTRSITAVYTPDRIEKDRVVWKAIKDYIGSTDIAGYGDCSARINSEEVYSSGCLLNKSTMEQLRSSMYKRIVKSFAIALKLSIFNSNNSERISNQLQEAKRVLELPEYNEAFRFVCMKEVEWRLRPVIICVRIGWMRGLWLLAKMQEKI